MPTKFDDLTERASRNYTFGIPEQALKNSKYLEEIMVKYGFVPNPYEWWHFNDKDCMSYDILDINLSELDK